MPPRQAAPSLPPLSLSAYCRSRKRRDKPPPTTAGWTAPVVCQFHLRSPVAIDPPSNAALICHPEFAYALKNRSVPTGRNGSHTRSNGRFTDRVVRRVGGSNLRRGVPGHGRGGFGRRQRCRFLSFARDALIARSPFRPAAWSEIAELLNVLIKRHSLRGLAGR